MFTLKTYRRVRSFVRRRGSVLQREVQFLGKPTMQIKFSTVKEVLKALADGGVVKITRQHIGKRVFVVIIWKGGAE